MYRDNIYGGLFGVAIGDALGATLEFLSKEEIKNKYGKLTEIIGGGYHQLEKGEITDDTAMTIAVAKGLIHNIEDPIEAIGKEFIYWFKSNPKSIGNTLKLTLKNYLKDGDWTIAAARTKETLNGRTAGNGSLMRTLPITFGYLEDKKKMANISAKVSRMTHDDIEAEISCVFYNRYTSNLIKKENKKLALQETLKETKDIFNGEKGEKIYGSLSSIDDIPLSELKASGYVVDTLLTAIKVFLSFHSFEKIVVETVNLGNDADTVGAVAGGLAGIFYGYSNIPKRWIQSLKDRQMIADLAEELVQTS